MAMTLLEKAQQILEEKRAKVIPENIKDDVTIFGVEGTAQTGMDTSDATATASDILRGQTAYVDGNKITGTLEIDGVEVSGVKQFTSIGQMQADANRAEGDIAVVYGTEWGDLVEKKSFSIAKFPKTVVLPEAITSIKLGLFDIVSDIYSDINVSLNKSWFDFYISKKSTSGDEYDMGEEYLRLEYRSDDGITYNLDSIMIEYDYIDIEDIEDSYYLLDVTGSTFSARRLDDYVGKFIQVESDPIFRGLYRCDSTLNYVVAPSQLTATKDSVFQGVEFYGAEGLDTGTLASEMSMKFDDRTAQVYRMAQDYYDNVEVIKIENGHRCGNRTYYIPCKTDGTPLWDTSSVTSMMHMFNSSYNLKTLPVLNTSNVTSLYAAFKASGIEYLPVWDTSKVTNMEQCFDGCANLKRLPNWNTSKVTNMSWMCSYCGKLVDVPIWDLSSATNIYKMFAEDGALSDESLNNILYMLAHAKTKSTLKNVGINSSQAARCQTLSNYQAFLDAGWTTGY